jgi:hypothetical protein
MRTMSRDVNLGGSYLTLIKAVRILKGCSQPVETRDVNASYCQQQRLAPLRVRQGEALSGRPCAPASADPSQDPLIPNAHGDLLAIEIF